MKTYIVAGIGDAFCMDSILTDEEKSSITEIYWGCKYGKVLAPIFKDNPYYPNLIKQHIVDEDEVKKYFNETYGENYEHHGNPNVCKFWHFKHDEGDFNHRGADKIISDVMGVNFFDLQNFSPQIFFRDPNREYNKSAFLVESQIKDFDYNSIDIEPGKYILMQHSSDNRPVNDISTINDRDWEITEEISIRNNIPVVIVTDRRNVIPPLSNYRIINVFDIPLENSLRQLVSLCKNSAYYIGLDSYIGILCSKVLPVDKLYVKSYNPNIKNEILTNVWLQKFFMPHTAQEVQKFYHYSL